MATAQNPNDDSARRVTKVFLQRDYSHGNGCRFQTKFPPELENKIDRGIFDQTISRINGILEEANKVGTRTYLEGCLGCLTAYLIYSVIDMQYDKNLKRLSEYITEQNQTVFVPRGLMLTHPMERGLRVVEITILNPSDMR